MAKGKNDKNDKAVSKADDARDQAKAAKDTRAGANGKAGGTGKKDAKKTPRPAVAAERATARSGSTLPGPPPPATVGEAVVPAARTAPEGTPGDVPATAPVNPAAAPAASASRPSTNGSAARPANGSGAGSATAPASGARPAAPAAAVVPAAASERRPGLVDELTTLAMMPVDVARRVLPERRLPFYLGVGALAVVGVVEWPVVLAAGMAWEALRRRRS